MQKDLRRRILPFFIPHLGCRRQCVYCNQKTIAGRAFPPATAEIERAIEQVSEDSPVQLAFYGGSFTELRGNLAEQYLSVAKAGIARGKIASIRVSACPDAISLEKIKLLTDYGVDCVELGIQSMNEAVLSAAGRDYDPGVVKDAITLLKRSGLKVVVQLMPGLPNESYQSCIGGALELARLKPDMARIYPLLVLPDTKILDLYNKGIYKPLSLAEAIALSADLIMIFNHSNIEVIRVGLNHSEVLAEQVLAGPYHPAFGDLCYSELALRQLKMLIKILSPTACLPLYLFAQKNKLSHLIGYRGGNRKWLETLPVSSVRFIGMETLPLKAVGHSFNTDSYPDEGILSYEEFLDRYTKENLFRGL